MDQNLLFDGSKTNFVNKICFLLTKFDGSKHQNLLLLMDQNNKICYLEQNLMDQNNKNKICSGPTSRQQNLLFCYFVILMDQKQNNKI